MNGSAALGLTMQIEGLYMKWIRRAKSNAHKGTDNKQWLLFWQQKTGKEALFCAVEGCMKQQPTGALVVSAEDEREEHLFVLPMCTEHCAQSEPMPMGTTYEPVRIGG